jgi:ribulose-phosphate 3-epimerase
MAKICPSVTATNPHDYREQIERVAPFANRLHLDFMDGHFAPTQSPPIESAWWPDAIQADIHVMYQNPHQHIAQIIHLNPHLVIVHAEADGNFVGFADTMHQAGIKVGVALLPGTSVAVVKPAIEQIDHVLIFSGTLGHFGGHADMQLLKKAAEVRRLKKNIEIGWDGGVTVENIAELIAGGVNVLNVGGAIQKADNPANVYAKLEALAGKQR